MRIGEGIGHLVQTEFITIEDMVTVISEDEVEVILGIIIGEVDFEVILVERV